ncbi:MAG: purine-nucleoside phosphorylase [Sphingobacteriales bacterium]|nr:purine-nucleoside phosphorylase [Sphingobacteriales bacterium]
MSIHISAQKGSIAKTVLLPGDPLRAKYIAEHFLQSPQLVSQTRNAFYYTGIYKGKTITVGASGMGCPSIGIYSYELFTEYEAETIIRIGTCGAYTTELQLFDLVNVDQACSESGFAQYAWGIEGTAIPHQGKAFTILNETAQSTGHPLKTCNIHSSDIFYRKTLDIPEVAVINHCLAVEMEAFALFANAQHLGKTAATLLTVSDVIPTHERISADQREKSLLPMMELALEASLKL